MLCYWLPCESSISRRLTEMSLAIDFFWFNCLGLIQFLTSKNLLACLFVCLLSLRNLQTLIILEISSSVFLPTLKAQLPWVSDLLLQLRVLRGLLLLLCDAFGCLNGKCNVSSSSGPCSDCPFFVHTLAGISDLYFGWLILLCMLHLCSDSVLLWWSYLLLAHTCLFFRTPVSQV